METTVKERIRLYISHIGISERGFCASIDVSPAYVGNISKSIQPDKLARISKQYPDLDIVWLLTGEGEMLRKSSAQNVSGNNSGVMINGENNNSPIDNRQYYSDSPDVLKAQIELLDERIKEKDAQIKEKDAQINKLLSILSQK